MVVAGAVAWRALWCLVALVALGLAAELRAQPAPTIGTAAVIEGRVLVTGHGESEARPLAEGTPLYEGDRVRTTEGARARLELEDGSSLQLGENTELFLEWVLFAPEYQSRNILLEVASGIVRSIVDAVVAASQVELRTNTAVTSVRGTDWITEADPGSTAILALEGEVAVQSAAPAIPGLVVLGPGEGTSVEAGEPPAPPSVWGEPRRDDFIARTAVPGP